MVAERECVDFLKVARYGIVEYGAERSLSECRSGATVKDEQRKQAQLLASAEDHTSKLAFHRVSIRTCAALPHRARSSALLIALHALLCVRSHFSYLDFVMFWGTWENRESASHKQCSRQKPGLDIFFEA